MCGIGCALCGVRLVVARAPPKPRAVPAADPAPTAAADAKGAAALTAVSAATTAVVVPPALLDADAKGAAAADAGDDMPPPRFEHAFDLNAFERLQRQCLAPRGPDCQQSVRIPLRGSGSGSGSSGSDRAAALSMTAAVLHLRGSTDTDVTPQPLIAAPTAAAATVTATAGSSGVNCGAAESKAKANYNAFCWNGEVFGGDAVRVPPGGSDTRALFARLSALRDGESVVDVMERVEGPWAMAFWHADTRTLWFGRDKLGRRTLLVALYNDQLLLSSVRVHDDAAAAIATATATATATAPAASTASTATAATSAAAVAAPAPAPGTGESNFGFVDSLHRVQWQELATTGLFSVTLPAAALIAGAPAVVVADASAAATYDTAADAVVSCALRHHFWSHIRRAPRDVVPATGSTATGSGGDGDDDDVYACTLSKSVHALADTLPFARARMDAAAALATTAVAPAAAAVAVDAKSTASVAPEPASIPVPVAASALASASEQLLACLSEAVRVRVQSIAQQPSSEHARVALLFSGGIDCMVLAALADRHLPVREPIDLVTVAFAGAHDTAANTAPDGDGDGDGNGKVPATRFVPTEVPDRVTAINGLSELQRMSPSRVWRLIEVDVTLPQLECAKARVLSLLHPRATVMDFNIGCVLWFGARARGRTHDAPRAPIVSPHCRYRQADVDAVTAAVGAAKATATATAAIAVTLPAPSSTAAGAAAVSTATVAPVAAVADAKAAVAPAAPAAAVRGDSKAEASRLGGNKRVWVERRQEHLTDEEKAARRAQFEGRQKLSKKEHRKREQRKQQETHTQSQLQSSAAGAAGAATASGAASGYREYQSRARVLLNGIGADELFGGYGRHRTVFRAFGAAALSRELDRDFGRLWRRNLGRDDRVCADSGRELRQPFLDERVAAFATALPLPLVCDLTLPPGVGDKRVLRGVCVLLGLPRTATLQKRAMQFGTRIANKNVAGYVAMSHAVSLAEIVCPAFLPPPTAAAASTATTATASSASDASVSATAAIAASAAGSSAAVGSRKASEALSKKVNRRLNKPGFNAD